MADRLWNGIDARLFEEFPALQAVVFAWLIARCPNEHGVYDLQDAALQRFLTQLQEQLAVLDRAELTPVALDQLKATGKVVITDQGAVWIVNKFKRSRYAANRDNQIGAVRDIGEHHPEVLDPFCARYGLSPGVGGPKDQRSPSIGGAPDPDPDPEPDPEAVKKQAEEEEPVGPTSGERAILNELETIPTYPYDYSKDLKLVRALAVDFPSVDLLDTVKTMALWLDRKPREKGSRQRLRYFCKTAARDAQGNNIMGYADRIAR